MAEQALNQEHEQWMDQPCQQQQANAAVAEDEGAGSGEGEDEGHEDTSSFALPSILLPADEGDGDGSGTGDGEGEGAGPSNEGDGDGEGEGAGDEGDGSGEGEGEGAGQQQAGEEEGDQVATVAQLIEHLEADPEWFNSLKVTKTVNGKPVETTIGDLIAVDQTLDAATQRLDEAKSKAQKLHQEAEQRSETVNKELATAHAMVSFVEETVFKHEAEQLQKIRDEYGAGSNEYHEARDALSAKVNTLRQAKQQIGNKLSSALEQHNREPSEEELAESQGKLFELVPDLKDEQARQDLMKYALDSGFTEDQLQAETNPLIFAIGYKAMLYDKHKSKANAVKEQVHKIPRMMKPGAQRPAKPKKPRDQAEALYGTK